MMGMDWTAANQCRRIIGTDARVMGIDIVFGLVYVVLGIFLSRTIWHLPYESASGPISMLCFVTAYLTMRICIGERYEKTAIFYANLPLDREVVYWAHSLSIALFILTIELIVGTWVIVVALSTGLHVIENVEPTLFLWPWLISAFLMWLFFDFSTWFEVETPLMIPVLVLLVIIVGMSLPILFAAHFGKPPQALGMLALTVFLQWKGCGRWSVVEIGELT